MRPLKDPPQRQATYIAAIERATTLEKENLELQNLNNALIIQLAAQKADIVKLQQEVARLLINSRPPMIKIETVPQQLSGAALTNLAHLSGLPRETVSVCWDTAIFSCGVCDIATSFAAEICKELR